MSSYTLTSKCIHTFIQLVKKIRNTRNDKLYTTQIILIISLKN
uniref:Uncharacterized protein n=1 Tax=Anguilla anguilla TaxID=7936 RepID=A0A0E9PD15_ANGAN